MGFDDTVTLTSSGKAFAGWKSIRVDQGLEQCSGGFDLGVSDRWSGQDSRVAIYPGEQCVVLIGTEPLVTGWVDAVETGLDAGKHDIRVSGRDVTADLVDCSAIRKSGQWQGQRIEKIAADLAAPFKAIKVRVDAGVSTGKPLATFALQEGETVFCAIDRAARMRGLMLTTDGKGSLVITRPGVGRIATPLVVGDNVLSLRVRVDWRDRHSSYVIKGQTSGVHWDGNSAIARAGVGKSASQMSAIATDPDVKRYRPLVMVGEAPDAGSSLHDRVLWEASVRAARALDVQVEVAGWHHAAGLWAPNRLVQLHAPAVGLDAELLLHRVSFALDEQGRRTTLTLTRPDAFKVLPIKEQANRAAGFLRPPKQIGRGDR